MAMQNMKNQIWYSCNEPLQLDKGINHTVSIRKNTKPKHQFLGFGFVEPRSRFAPTPKFASFWLNKSISADE